MFILSTPGVLQVQLLTDLYSLTWSHFVLFHNIDIFIILQKQCKILGTGTLIVEISIQENKEITWTFFKLSLRTKRTDHHSLFVIGTNWHKMKHHCHIQSMQSVHLLITSDHQQLEQSATQIYIGCHSRTTKSIRIYSKLSWYLLRAVLGNLRS